jgi:hypothetical protein
MLLDDFKEITMRDIPDLKQKVVETEVIVRN